MSTKSLNKALGIDDDELDQIIKNAESGVKSNNPSTQLANVSQEEIDRYNKKKEETAKLKETLALARNMTDKDWAKQVIKAGVDSAMMIQLQAAQDIEDDYRSNKVQSVSELTNAIVNGAKAVVDMEQGERSLDIQKERNDIRKLEVTGKMKMLDGQGHTVQGGHIGTKRDLLKLINSGATIDINKDETPPKTE
jgi:predicted TIM-barrel fold metal-dependent hydrolase